MKYKTRIKWKNYDIGQKVSEQDANELLAKFRFPSEQSILVPIDGEFKSKPKTDVNGGFEHYDADEVNSTKNTTTTKKVTENKTAKKK